MNAKHLTAIKNGELAKEFAA